MNEKITTLALSLEQKETLERDMHIAKSPESLFQLITDTKDQNDFFDLARNLIMADGEYHKSEQTIMAQLQKMQIKKTDIDKMVGHVRLELETDKPKKEEPKKGFFSFLKSKKD